MIYAVLVIASIALAALLAVVLVARQLSAQVRDLASNQAEQLAAVGEHAASSQQQVAEHLAAVQARHAADLDRAYHCQQAETRDLMNRVMEFAEVRHTMMMSASELREQQRQMWEADDAPKLYTSDIPDDDDAFEVAEREYGITVDDHAAVQAALSSAAYRFGPGAEDEQ